MKSRRRKKESWLLGITFIAAIAPGTVFAQQTFVSGSTGADGPFNPTTSVTLPLPPNGVFNFTTVNIPAGVFVGFSRNALNTPVFILATGDITVNGQLHVDGSPGTAFIPGQGGPGGFDGGNGNPVLGGPAGAGLGPGGGSPGPLNGCGGGGGFGTAGSPQGLGGAAYGNDFLVPLIGGSGGGGGRTNSLSGPGTGGGGGGAILIATSGTLGSNNAGAVIVARGRESINGGSGAGGAIRLVATNIAGRFEGVSVSGGVNGCQIGGVDTRGGSGRLRIEFINNLGSIIAPGTIVGRPSAVFVPNNPTLQITSIGGTAVPVSPLGSYSNPDISLPPATINPVSVNLTATNIPLGTPITLTVTPQYGDVSTATSTPLSGTTANSTATVNINLQVGSGTPVVLMAQASFAIQTAALDIPGYEGVKIARVNVKTTMTGESAITYVTDTGREILAKEVGPLLYAAVEGSGVK
jgi:hypothetical protein